MRLVDVIFAKIAIQKCKVCQVLIFCSLSSMCCSRLFEKKKPRLSAFFYIKKYDNKLEILLYDRGVLSQHVFISVKILCIDKILKRDKLLTRNCRDRL